MPGTSKHPFDVIAEFMEYDWNLLRESVRRRPNEIRDILKGSMISLALPRTVYDGIADNSIFWDAITELKTGNDHELAFLADLMLTIGARVSTALIVQRTALPGPATETDKDPQEREGDR